MKHSLKRELFLSVILLVIILLGGSMLVNNFLLERYYVHRKQSTLVDVYRELNEIDDEYVYLTDDFENYFQQISENNNIQLVIVNADRMGTLKMVYESKDSKIMRGRIEGYLYGFSSDNIKTTQIERSKSYIIERCNDYSAGNEFLEIFGAFHNGSFFLMRSPLQQIRENASISNRFMAYILIFGLVISFFLTWWMSEKITKPIKELTMLSERMANLEFDAKYHGTVKNEIGKLGDNYNYLSEQLEKTISELKTANNELKNDLEERTQIEEMRKEFLSNVTHELKTPIALIQGYAEGLSECINEDDGSREFYCDVIVDEAAKMNHMVKMMLSLNQLESGKDMLQMDHFDLTELVKGVANSTKMLAEQKNATITFEHMEKPVYVWADQYKIEEVVTNYISNAIHHVDYENQIRITFTREEDTVKVSVFNTGKNIPESDLDKIWVKFYKVDKARTREYGGSGIGLSIVKAIMDLHHQEYGVENKKGGVEFWFKLDCDKGQMI